MVITNIDDTYYVKFLGNVVYSSNSYDDCWEYMMKRGDLYVNLLLWD